MCEPLISLQTLPTFGYNYSTKHSIVSSIRARVKVRRTFSFTLHFFCVALYNEQLIHWYFIHYFYRTIAIIWYGILNAVLSMWSKNGDQKWLPALKVIFFANETNYRGWKKKLFSSMKNIPKMLRFRVMQLFCFPVPLHKGSLASSLCFASLAMINTKYYTFLVVFTGLYLLLSLNFLFSKHS